MENNPLNTTKTPNNKEPERKHWGTLPTLSQLTNRKNKRRGQAKAALMNSGLNSQRNIADDGEWSGEGDSGLLTPPCSQDATTMLISPPPEEVLRLGWGSARKLDQHLFTPSLLVNNVSRSSVSASKRKRPSVVTAPPTLQSLPDSEAATPHVKQSSDAETIEATPNPKARKQPKSKHRERIQSIEMDSPTRSSFLASIEDNPTTPTKTNFRSPFKTNKVLIQSPHAANPDADFVPPILVRTSIASGSALLSARTLSRRNRSATPIPPYEPPKEVFTPPREVTISPPHPSPSKARRKSKANAKVSEKKADIVGWVKKEMPEIDWSTPMPPASPGDDPLLLSGRPRPRKSGRSSRAAQSSPTQNTPRYSKQLRSQTEPLPEVEADESMEVGIVGFDIGTGLSELSIPPDLSTDLSDEAVGPDLPLFDLSAPAAFDSNEAWSDSDSDRGGDGEGEYTGHFRMMTVPTKADPPTSGTRSRMDEWGRPISPFPGTARKKQFSLPSVDGVDRDEYMDDLPVFDEPDDPKRSQRVDSVDRDTSPVGPGIVGPLVERQAWQIAEKDVPLLNDQADGQAEVSLIQIAKAEEVSFIQEVDEGGEEILNQDQDAEMSDEFRQDHHEAFTFQTQLLSDDFTQSYVGDAGQLSCDTEPEEHTGSPYDSDLLGDILNIESVEHITSHDEASCEPGLIREVTAEEEDFEEEQTVDRELSREPEDHDDTPFFQYPTQGGRASHEANVKNLARWSPSTAEARNLSEPLVFVDLDACDTKNSTRKIPDDILVVNDETSSMEEESDDVDEGVVTITSSDPVAAARAAAILKLHDYDYLPKLLIKHRRVSHATPESVARRARRKSAVAAGIKKNLSTMGTRRRSALGGILGDRVFIPGSPVMTMPELLMRAEVNLEDVERVHSTPPRAMSTHRDPFTVPILKASRDSTGSRDTKSEWTKEDWKQLDGCFTDERLEVGERKGLGEDVLADVDDVQLEDVVMRFVEMMGGCGAVNERGSSWDENSILARTRALQKKQRSGSVAPRTPGRRSPSLSRLSVAPDFTPLTRRRPHPPARRPRLPPPIVESPFDLSTSQRPKVHGSLLAPRYSHLLEKAIAINQDEPCSEGLSLDNPDASCETSFVQDSRDYVHDKTSKVVGYQAPTGMLKRVRGSLFSYLPTLAKSKSSQASDKIRPCQPCLPLPPSEVLGKSRGPIATPIRPPAPKVVPPKDQVSLQHAPLPARSFIPRPSKPRRLVELHPTPPPIIPEHISVHRSRRSSGGSVKDLIKTFEILDEDTSKPPGITRARSISNWQESRKEGRPTWKP